MSAGTATVDPRFVRLGSPGLSRDPALVRGFSILLVDDFHRCRPLLRALRNEGYHVVHATDGVSCESLCRESTLEVDALVARTEMQHVRGIELAHRVLRLRPEVRVLLMGHPLERSEEVHRAHEDGYDVIEEPFTPEQLCRRLMGLLGSARFDACADPRLDAGAVPSMRWRKSSPSLPSRKIDFRRGTIHGTQ